MLTPMARAVCMGGILGPRGDQRGRRQHAMRASWRRMFVGVEIAATVAACGLQSGTTYAPGETGAVMRVDAARVVSRVRC
jgi:hypothetical protein